MHEYFGGTIGERIEELIKEKKISQEKLAQAVSVSKATMSRYIKGETDIPGKILIKIARYLIAPPIKS